MKAVSQASITSTPSTSTDCLECYLLILRSADREFLSLAGDALPTLRVPEKQRIPPYIVDGLKAYGVGTICRFISRKSQSDTARVVVMDAIDEQAFRPAHTWLPITLLEGFEADGLNLTEVLDESFLRVNAAIPIVIHRSGGCYEVSPGRCISRHLNSVRSSGFDGRQTLRSGPPHP